MPRWCLPLVLALAFAPRAIAAQELPDSYMGIDLTAEPEPIVEAQPVGEAQQREVGILLRPLLDEGVELECLALDPPASFSQTDNRSAECQEYIARLAAATGAPQAEAETADEEAEDDPWRFVPLVTLAQAAQSGNKQAQLELGIRFEEGRGGVDADPDRARELYETAARPTPARYGIVNSGVEQAGRGGSLSRRQTAPRVPGLREARERLEALETGLAQ